MANPERNWAGNIAFSATSVHRPTSLDELRSVVVDARTIHVIGSRHSFNDIADGAELLSLDALGQTIEIDAETATVRVGGGIRYSDLVRKLDHAGFALHNMASLPHITVAGAIATATHGSGDTSGNLATAVQRIELVTGDGDLIQSSRGDADFEGMVVGLGALGIVTHLTLALEPHYLMSQQVFEHLSLGSGV